MATTTQRWRHLADGFGQRVDGVPDGRGDMTLEALVAMTGLMDLLVHTWDLARATGQDETLDREEASALLAGIEPWDAALRSSGYYGPRVPVPDDADEQTRLLAFTGRRT
jgi:uncharacterized protein (TIGR03086 family)